MTNPNKKLADAKDRVFKNAPTALNSLGDEITPTAFKTWSDDELAERLGEYLAEHHTKYPLSRLLVLNIKKDSHNLTTIASREWVLAQISEADKSLGVQVKSELSDPQYHGQLPVYGVDLRTGATGLVWWPCSNSVGGEA